LLAVKEMKDKLRKFFKSADFYKSMILILAVLIPVQLSKYLWANSAIGFSMALGVFFNSLTNIAGSVKHRTYGMLFSVGLTFFATLAMGYAAFSLWLLLPVLATLTFSISYLSVYGFRASLVALSGMFALVISFANEYVQLSVFEYASLVGLGGLWYAILASLFNFLNPKMYVEELLSDAMDLTSAYLEIRSKLLTDSTRRSAMSQKLFELQATLTAKHETLRNILFTRRKKSGFSNKMRRELLVFIELVDLLELASATPVDYEEMDRVFKKNSKEVHLFATFIHELAEQFSQVSKAIVRSEKVVSNPKIATLLEEIETAVRVLSNTENKHIHKKEVFMLSSLLEYQVAQSEKLKSIERVLNTMSLKNSLVSENRKETPFLTAPDYGVHKLKSNFTFQSSIFRHALRLSIAMVIGFLIGEFLSFQNSYWILITLLVIMRPSYGLTKKRVKQRVVGTLMGAVFSLGMVYLTQDTFVFGVIAVVSLSVALSFVQLNYKTFAVFITIHIVFVYALYSSDVIHAIQFRIVDTLVGAVLATLSNLFLFPSWEYMTVDDSILEALKTQQVYLKEIYKKYRDNEPTTIAYKVSRKKAFLAMGELNSAFQRMTQEPKSRQKYFNDLYKIVVLTNTLLSSLASLGTYVRNHANVPFSEHVEGLGRNIKINLQQATALLKSKPLEYASSSTEFDHTQKYPEEKMEGHIAYHPNKEKLATKPPEEVRLVLDQFSYLSNLAQKIYNRIEGYQGRKN
jgi:uncharacterized membrane protein YccC